MLTFAENDIAATVARLCGNTIKITFTPPFAIPAATTGITYTLRFGFEDGYSDNLGSNLSTGELYPSINVGYSPTITLTDNRVILATGIESYSNTNYSTYIAIEDTPGSGNVDLTVDLFYTNENGDP